MERITKRIDNYIFVSDNNKALHRLADYEDTGLDPEQIYAMDEEYTKLAAELGKYKKGYSGNDIKRLRKEKKITQEFLAKKLNISQSAISQLEHKKILSNKTINKIKKIKDEI